ncbi:IS1 family transposase [Edwardsiella tarda]
MMYIFKTLYSIASITVHCPRCHSAQLYRHG